MIERIQSRLARALTLQVSASAVRTNSGTALGTSVGLVRKRNEDCCLVVRASYATSANSSFTVAVVCDGLGGMSEGREAAILAASAFSSSLFCTSTSDLRERLSRAVAYANAEVHRKLRGNGGTTLSAVITSPYHGAMLCHVGDSRVYGVSSDRTLEQLSRDDTINAFLKKRESEGEAAKDSRLLQFVGMGDEMEAQIKPISGQFRSVLITSDGAHDVPSSVLQRVVTSALGGSDLIRKLLALADMLGGRDNASAILLPTGDEAEAHVESDENEMVAILPNDTILIYAAGSQISRQLERPYTPTAGMPRQEPSRWIEDSPNGTKDSKAAVLKPSAPQGKERINKPRNTTRRSARSKAEVAGRLPLEEPNNEVDVQFSSPSLRTEGNKQ